ncbi:MAG: hypothetical protein M3N08_05055, partial [Pseudomonadota bacterium]|nr:hypothetical protein [Pseudomonadota bacterium]
MRLRVRAALGIMVLMLLAAPEVRAAAACYTPAELQAEQWLRLHSELMVTTVTCHQSSLGENLVPFYTRFTQTH